MVSEPAAFMAANASAHASMFGVKIDRMLCSVVLRMKPLPGCGFPYYSVRILAIARHPLVICACG